MQIGSAELDCALPPTPAAVGRASIARRATFNGFRFVAAGMICLVAGFGSIGQISRNDIVGGVVVGGTFGAGMLCQLCGLQFARPSTSSFLTALAVVFAPVAQALFLRRPVGRRVWTAVAITTLGMLVLCAGSPDGSVYLAVAPPAPYLGEILTVLGSLFFTVQILALDHFGTSAHSGRLTVVMLLTAGLLNACVGCVTGGGGMYRVSSWVSFSHSLTLAWTFGGLVLFSSVLAMYLMNAWQPLLAPATASVIYCLEPVFGTLFSLAFKTETANIYLLIGGAIILSAVLTIATRPADPEATQSI